MTIDLTVAVNCLRAQGKSRIHDGAKIGRVCCDIGGEISMISGFPAYREGEIVLFHEELIPSNGELRMGEYIGTKQKPTGKITIEVPLQQEEIEKQQAQGSLITTLRTMIGVPKEYVEEIRF